MVASTGVIGVEPEMSAGAQYEAVSAVRRQLVVAASSDDWVEKAFVELLPTYWCRCERPGCPGYTIRSSLFWWLKAQLLMKFTPAIFRSAVERDDVGAEPARATAASAPPRRTKVETASPSR